MVTVQGDLGRPKSELDWKSQFSGESTLLSQPDLKTAIASSVTQLIGWTPMVYLNKVVPEGLPARVAVKVESMQPLNSVKDRTMLSLVEELERNGKITPGKSKLLEMTSGNAGLGLALVAAVKGYELTCVMPASVSEERKIVTLALGGKVVLTPREHGLKGVAARAFSIAESDPDIVLTRQIESAANPGIHYITTGPEIWSQTNGKIDIFIAGTGTGGTLTGAGTFFKEQRPDIKVMAIEPEESPFLTTGQAGPHDIQGIGPGRFPTLQYCPYKTPDLYDRPTASPALPAKLGLAVPALDQSILDEILIVSSKDASEMARRLGREEGLFVGPSSGAAAVAAIRVASRPENAGKLVVTILPSFGERYLTTSTYKCFVDEAAQLPIVALTDAEKEVADGLTAKMNAKASEAVQKPGATTRMNGKASEAVQKPGVDPALAAGKMLTATAAQP